MAMSLTDMFNDYVSNSNLTYNINYLRFKTVLQTHLVAENSIKDNCAGSCDEVKSMKFNDADCIGTLHDCYDLAKLLTTGFNEKIYSVN